MDYSSLPLYDKKTVVVCGAGTAGVFAAIAAADQGMDVLLIEQFGRAGGTPTSGLTTPMMSTRIEGEPLCSYLSLELFEELLKKGGGAREFKFRFDPVALAAALEEMCVSHGVKLLFHTFISDVVTEGEKVKYIVISNKKGLQRVEGDYFIDCTGDGDVCVMAGADYTKGNPETGKNQPISLRYIVGGVDVHELGRFIAETAKKEDNWSAASYTEGDINSIYMSVTGSGQFAFTNIFKQAIEAGDLVEEDMLYWQGFVVPGREDAIAYNNPEFFDDTDATDPDVLTKTQVLGKRAIYRQLAFYKKYFKGFDKAYIADVAAMVGIRESRNITTDYVVTAEDVYTKKKFDDTVCQSNYPIDVHGRKLNFDESKMKDNDGKPYYELPYSCTVVKGFDNLSVAGRCVGAEFYAQSSLRVIYVCRSLGEAAGIGVAKAAKKKAPVRSIGGQEIREEMKSRGAEFKDR